MSDWNDGITPKLQWQLRRAAKIVRTALAAVDDATVEPDSDADLRCDNVTKLLEEALYDLEWSPPADH